MKRVVAVIFVLAVFSLVLGASATPAVAAEKGICDIPIVNLACAPFEFGYSFFKTPFDGTEKVYDRIDPIDWAGNGAANALQRLYGPFIGESRGFGEKGYIANSRVASYTLGGVSILFGYGIASGVHNTFFGVSRVRHAHSLLITKKVDQRVLAWAVTGAMVGLGTGAVVDVIAGSDSKTDTAYLTTH